jgi:hypothetical protein
MNKKSSSARIDCPVIGAGGYTTLKAGKKNPDGYQSRSARTGGNDNLKLGASFLSRNQNSVEGTRTNTRRSAGLPVP